MYRGREREERGREREGEGERGGEGGRGEGHEKRYRFSITSNLKKPTTSTSYPYFHDLNSRYLPDLNTNGLLPEEPPTQSGLNIGF